MIYWRNNRGGDDVTRYIRANYNGVKGDGVSYPEKVGKVLFPIVDSDCKYQYSPKWANGKKYDFYLPKYDMIVELHGVQHYKVRSFMGDQTENDAYKRSLAKENGITFYYEIDCRKSIFSFIKNNIVQINEIDWSQIDWEFVANEAERDIVKIVCKHKRENPDVTIRELSELFNVSTHAIRTYVEKGSDLGWCDYNFKELLYQKNGERLKGEGNPNPSKTVLAYKDGTMVGRYSSLEECCDPKLNGLGIKFNKSDVSRVCNGKRKHSKGYTFKYE